MDLMRLAGRIMVAGPDTTASVSPRDGEPFVGLRFRPGVLPRLLGVPASELRNERVPLSELQTGLLQRGSLTELAAALASAEPRAETAPWSLPVLSHVTGTLAAGSAVTEVAQQVGWSSPHAAAPVLSRLRLRPGDAATHPALPARGAVTERRTAVDRGGHPRRICRPTPSAPRGQRSCGRAAGVAASGIQQCEQIHPIAVRVGDGRITHPPRRVVRRQRAGMPCGRDLLEQCVDLRRRRDAERKRQSAGRRTTAASIPDACLRWFPPCQATACFLQAARPRRGARPGPVPAGRAVGRNRSIVRRS